MPESSSVSAFAYRAFISYSHADRAWCDWLHKALETYRVPSRLVGKQTSAGKIPRRLHPIFRDRDELPSAIDLNQKVEAAMRASAWLIVICSPRSAPSRWVNEEVLAFKRMGRADRILCLIVDGEPNASDKPGHESEECFCPVLRHRIDANGALTDERTEPIAADARAGKDGNANAKLKLIAGMLDVGFDALKQREQQRRVRRMTAVSALAVIVMLVTTALAINAMVARNDAQRRQKQAEDLVGFMLGDLNDKLSQVARLDVMEAVDDKAMAYFESLPDKDVTDEALAQRAKALEKIGNVRDGQGHLPAALESYEAAAKIARSLADMAPQNAARQIAYSRVLAWIGFTYMHQSKLDMALHSFEAAQSVLKRVGTQTATSHDLTYQLSVIYNDIGHVFEARGQLDQAAVQYQNNLRLMERLMAATPDNTSWASDLGAAHNDLGKLALMRGDLVTAVAEYRADDTIETSLSKHDPTNNPQRENMLRVRAILGRTLALAGDLDAGTKDLQQAVDIAMQLVKADPNESDPQEFAAIYASQLSRLRRLDDDLPAAKALTRRALEILAKLTKQDPANTGWQQDLAEVQIEQTAQSPAGGQSDAARVQVQAALNILDPLFAIQPDNRGLLLDTVSAKLLLAGITDDAQAARQLREGASQAMQSVQSGAGDPRLLALRVEALLALNRMAEAKPVIRQLRDSGYRDAALLALLQRRHIDYPANAALAQRQHASKQRLTPTSVSR